MTNGGVKAAVEQVSHEVGVDNMSLNARVQLCTIVFSSSGAGRYRKPIRSQ